MEASRDYRIRFAQSEDADVIAAHRSRMFGDMGVLNEDEVATMHSSAIPWLRRMLATGQYIGWLVEHAGVVVAGAGVLLQEQGPVPGCLRVAGAAHVVNVYTAPPHRRKGIARQLMSAILSWCASNDVEHITLHTSPEASHLYEELGFRYSPELMKYRPK